MWNLNCGIGSTGTPRWRAKFDDQPVGSWYQVTALHWTGSNNDVDLIEALLEVGADIERPGSSINGAPYRFQGGVSAIRFERGAGPLPVPSAGGTGLGTRLLLAEGSDLVAVVEGWIDLGELLTRKHRRAAETGAPLLTAAQILTYSLMGYAS